MNVVSVNAGGDAVDVPTMPFECIYSTAAATWIH